MSAKERSDIVTKDKKCIHEGHRARLTDLAFNAGLDNLSNFQVMEFFLSYIFPRGDVNPLAHRLLDRFETFTHAIEASVEDLKTVKGINDRSAKMIHMFSELFYYFTESKMGRKCVIKNRAEIIDIVEDHLRFRNSENMLLLALSPSNIITHKRRLSMNKEDEVGISMIELSTFLASANPTSLVIAHGHPYGSSTPSKTDNESFKKMKDFCFSCGVNLIDSLIVGEDGVFSQSDNKILRKYYDVEDLKKAFGNFA